MWHKLCNWGEEAEHQLEPEGLTAAQAPQLPKLVVRQQQLLQLHVRDVTEGVASVVTGTKPTKTGTCPAAVGANGSSERKSHQYTAVLPCNQLVWI